MKAFNIIEELTKDSYGMTSTLTTNSASNMVTYLRQLFGKDYEIIFDRGNILLPPGKERRFFYMINNRFDRRFDSEIYAILSVNRGLVYIYEVE